MYLTELVATGVRNLANEPIAWSPAGNWLLGPNGSGKTSILESLYALSTGRSFRANTPEVMIARGATEMIVRGRVHRSEAEHWLAIRRERSGKVTARLDGGGIGQASRLAEALRIFVIEASTSQLVLGGPRLRRMQLDWGLFHVEPSFARVWTQFQRVLAQRSAALKTKDGSEVAWNEPYLAAAEAVDRLRRQHIEALSGVVSSVISRLDAPPVELRYRPGWPASETLRSSLASQSERERRLGVTLLGPHRADVLIAIDGQAAQTVLSRGQAKSVAFAWVLAQVKLLVETSRRNATPGSATIAAADELPVVLLDDLLAELDDNAARAVTHLLNDEGVQYFVAATLPSPPSWFRNGVDRAFHVERGTVRLLVG